MSSEESVQERRKRERERRAAQSERDRKRRRDDADAQAFAGGAAISSTNSASAASFGAHSVSVPNGRGTEAARDANGTKTTERKPTTLSAGQSRQSNKKRSDFVVSMRYTNPLPEVPVSSKFLHVDIARKPLCAFQKSALDRLFKHHIVPPSDLGITIDLVDPIAFSPAGDLAELDERDQELLDMDSASRRKKTRTVQEAADVPWLRKSEYMTADYESEKLYLGRDKDLIQKSNIDHEEEEIDVDEQIALIERSFNASNSVPVHPTKPDLKPVEIFPFLPSTEHWPNDYKLVAFDTDPVPWIKEKGIDLNGEEDVTRDALLHAVMDVDGSSVVVYITPKLEEGFVDVSLFREIEDDEKEYEFVRGYQFRSHNLRDTYNSRHTDYVICFQDQDGDDGTAVTYNEISAKLEVKKKAKADKMAAEFSSIRLRPQRMPKDFRLQRRRKMNELRAVPIDIREEDLSSDEEEDETIQMDIDTEEKDESGKPEEAANSEEDRETEAKEKSGDLFDEGTPFPADNDDDGDDFEFGSDLDDDETSKTGGAKGEENGSAETEGQSWEQKNEGKEKDNKKEEEADDWKDDGKDNAKERDPNVHGVADEKEGKEGEIKDNDLI